MPTELQTKISEAITAQEAGDLTTALAKMRSARLLISSFPNLTIRSRGITWSASGIDAAIKDILQQQGASSAIRRVPLKWGGPQT